MTGYVKLEALGENGIQADVELMQVGSVDKVMLLDAFMQSVHMSDEDVLMALLMRASGAVRGEASGMSFDMDTLKKMADIANGEGGDD